MAVLYFLTHTAKDDLNTGFGCIHGSWPNSMHSAETPINSPRKPPGSILIACLMRKVRHALWQTPGKLYRLLMSHFHSLPSQLSAARSLVLLLRKRWRGEEATQVWAGLDHRLLHHVQKMSVQEPRFNLEVQTKSQHQGMPEQLYSVLETAWMDPFSLDGERNRMDVNES